MNYFEFYQLPLSFHPDQNLVKQQFYALSKKYHPDFYINESDEKQEEVLELSTVNNKAFQVLKNPSKILPYILEIKGIITDGEHYSLPQSFLMEMMDVNEVIMDLQFEPDAEKLAEVKQEIQRVEDNLKVQLGALTANFDNTDEIAQKNVLNDIKDLFYRNKYILRLKESLAKT